MTAALAEPHIAAARAEMERVRGCEAKLRVAAQHHLRLFSGNFDLAVVFQVELRQSTKFMKRFSASWLRDYFALLDDAVEDAQNDGTLRADLPPPGPLRRHLIDRLDASVKGTLSSRPLLQGWQQRPQGHA